MKNKTKALMMVVALVLGATGSLLADSICNTSCQVAGTTMGATCATTVILGATVLTVEMPVSGVVVGLALDGTIDQCTDFGAWYYEQCYDAFGCEP